METSYCRSYRGKLQAVVLDWAGTIIDYGSTAPAEAFIQLFKKYRVPISDKEARASMGLDKKEHIKAILRNKSVLKRWAYVYGEPPSPFQVENMYSDFIPLLKKIIAEKTGLIPGTLEAVAEFRNRSLRIGSTSGYDRDIMNIILPIAKEYGFEPDALVCTSDVPSGRPDPWMALKCAMHMRVYPMASIVKIGDTLLDIAEGLNAGMWTIGIAKTGNELGLREEETSQVQPQILERKLECIHDRMHRAGAHFVVDGINDVFSALDKISEYLEDGTSPLGNGIQTL